MKMRKVVDVGNAATEVVGINAEGEEVVMGLELAKERIQSRKHAEEVPLS